MFLFFSFSDTNKKSANNLIWNSEASPNAHNHANKKVRTMVRSFTDIAVEVILLFWRFSEYH